MKSSLCFALAKRQVLQDAEQWINRPRYEEREIVWSEFRRGAYSRAQRVIGFGGFRSGLH